jgi:hypothetical protein
MRTAIASLGTRFWNASARSANAGNTLGQFAEELVTEKFINSEDLRALYRHQKLDLHISRIFLKRVGGGGGGR